MFFSAMEYTETSGYFNPTLVMLDIGDKIYTVNISFQDYLSKGNVCFITATFEIVSTNYLVIRLL